MKFMFTIKEHDIKQCITVNMIDMYEKLNLIVLVLFIIVQSEELSSDATVNTKFLDSSLSTAFPYLSPCNDQHLTKNNRKKSLLLLMPHIQHERENKTIYKTKRCSTLSQRNRLLSLKESFARTRPKSSENINVGISKNNLNTYDLARNMEDDMQDNSAILDKREAKPRKKDKIFLRVLKDDDVDGKEAILNFQARENIKKCNKGKCICYCKDENYSPMSSEKSSSLLGFAKKDKPERINHRIPEHENRPNVLQRLFPQRLFPIRSYQERLGSIPAILIPYEIVPNLPPYIPSYGNVGKSINVGNPSTLLEGKPNCLVGSNVHSQYRPFIHQNPYLNLPVTERSGEAERLDPSTSSSTSYIDATTVTETESVLESYDPIEIIKNAQESPNLITEIPNDYIAESLDPKTKNSFYPNYSTATMIEEGNAADSGSSDETLHKSGEFTEVTEANKNNDFAKITATDYVSASNAPSSIYSPITHDGKLISMQECMKLFGRDVCVLSATSSQTSADPTQKNNLNGYTTIAIPEYVIQTSTKKSITTDYDNYLNKHFASMLSTSEKSNVNSDETSESTITELNTDDEISPTDLSQYTGSVVENYKPHADSDKDELSSTAKDTPSPKKNLRTQTTDKTVGTVKNKLLGKSKSHKSKLPLSPNSKEMQNPVSSEKFLHSATLHEYNDSNLKVNQEKKINTWKNIPQEETTVSNYVDSRTKHDFEDGSINYLKEPVTNYEEEVLQERPKEQITTINQDFDTGYNFETQTTNYVKSDHDTYSDEEDQSTTRYIDYEESNESSNKDNSFNINTGSSIRKLPFCDNTLLLNSIRKVINDFILDPRVGRTIDLDDNILQLHGRSLLPEILAVPHLKNILLIPQIEDMIVEKAKDVLSLVTSIPRKDLTNNWSHGIIRNTLRNILEAYPGFHQKLPPMTVEEHRFKNGQWTTNVVPLAPLVDNQLSKPNLKKLKESITNLLSSSAIASQRDQPIVRNIILQSVKNSLINDEENEEMDDSVIYNALNDILEILKQPDNIDTLEKSNEFLNNDKNIKMNLLQEMPPDRKMKNDKTLLDQQNLGTEEEARINDNRMQIASTQKAKVLENNAIVASESPNLSESYDKNKNIYREKEIPNKAIDIIKANRSGDQILDGIRKTNVQSEESKLVEPLEPTIIYQKAILQTNPNILKASTELNSENELNSEGNNNNNIFSEATTISPIAARNLYEKSGEKEISEINPTVTHTRNDINKSPTNDFLSNDLILENTENHRTVDRIMEPTYFMQETSPNYIEVSDGIIFPSIAQTKTVDEIEHPLNGKIVTATSDNLISSANVKYENPESKIVSSPAADEIDPAIILARLEYNLPPIKYYSPETLKYVQNHYIGDKNAITTSANFMQEISPNHIQISDSIIAQNMAGSTNTGDRIEDTSNGKIITPSADNLISSENNMEYGNHESQTSPLTDKDILKLQRHNFMAEDNIVKIHEVTTEIQRTYAKTTYFKPKFSENNSSINLLSSPVEITDDASNCNSKTNMNGNKNNNNYNLIGNINNINPISAEANEATIISSAKSSLDDIYSLQLLPSSTAFDDISALQNSQIYYINDDVKLPVEIIALKNGSYALSISPNICEIILRRKCPCCVPLQGRIVRSPGKNYQKYVIAGKKDDWSTDQSSPSIATNSVTAKSTLQKQKQEEEIKEQKEEINAHNLWKRNLNKNNLTISLPVIDFARKYNLLLDFNEEDVLFNGIEPQKRNIEMSQSGRLADLKLNKNNMQDKNTEIAEDNNYSDDEKIKYQKETEPILQNVNILNKKEKREHKEWELIDDEQNDSRIRILKENKARSYRHEQTTNTNNAPKGTKVIRSMLYWLKSLFER